MSQTASDLAASLQERLSSAGSTIGQGITGLTDTLSSGYRANQAAVEEANAGQSGGVDFGAGLLATPAGQAYQRRIEEASRAEDEIAARNREVISNPLLGAATSALEPIHRGLALGHAAVAATPEAIYETGNALGTPVGLGREGPLGMDTPFGRVGPTDIALTLAPSAPLQAALNLPIGGHLPAAAGPAASRFTGALESAGDTAATAVRGAVGRAASGLSDAWAGNAERLAAADARMAAEGSVAAPGTLGALPEEYGQAYPPLRGDVRGVVREQLGETSSEFLADSRFPRDAVHPDLRAAGIGPEITPQIDLSERLNAGFGVVPSRADLREVERRIADANGAYTTARIERARIERELARLPDDPELQQDLMGALRQEEYTQGKLDAAREWSQMVRTGDRTLATAGTLPGEAPPDRLAGVNRVLGQGLASSVSGGVGAQINQEMNPDDPNAALKGFAVGALGPLAATRGVRAGLRAAGRLGAGAERAEGALGTLGNLPARQARMAGLGEELVPPLERGPSGYAPPDLRRHPGVPATELPPERGDALRSALPGLLRGLNAPQPAAAAEGASLVLPDIPAASGPYGRLQAALNGIGEALEPVTRRANIGRYAGMLSDAASHVQNILGGATSAAIDVGTLPPMLALDIARSKLMGTPREVFAAELPARLAGMRHGARQGMGRALEIMRSGVPAEEAAKLDQGGVGFDTNIPGLAPRGSGRAGAVNVAVESPLRALAAADAVFKTMAQGGHLMAEATAEAMRRNGGRAATPEQVLAAARDPALLERVQELSLRSVLQESRRETGAIRAGISKLGPLGQGIAALEMPFTKTPYNVVAQGMGMTPLGLAGLVEDVAQGRAPREMERRLGRVALGTAAMAVAAAQYDAGTLIGPRPDSEAEASTWPPGQIPWSYKVEVPGVGTYYQPLSALGVLALPVVATVLYKEAEKSGTPLLSAEMAGTLAAGLGQYAEQNTFFEGFGNISKVLSDPTRQAERHFEQIASQFAPHVVGGGGAGRMIQRIMGMPARDPQGALEALLASLPYQDPLADVTGRSRVLPRQDVLGRPQALGASGPVAAVARVGEQRDAGVIRAFRRAGEGLPMQAPPQLRDDALGRQVRLTPGQKQRWRREFGAELQSQWAASGNPSDLEALQRLKTAARKVADDTVLGRR
ncbi:MAG TPA: hypothetical protein VIL10_05380 [Marmoricola sp.]